jgi:hypothetical protein
MSVQELETAVSSLAEEQLAEFRAWFEQFASDAWDRQIEKDARSGRLDALYQRLKGENEGHAHIPLDEVLDDEKFS